MGFFDLFRKTDINAGVEQACTTPGAVLLDVRSAAEYREGHIPGSVNIPEDNIRSILNTVQDYDTPIFAYCLSGARSGRAVSALKALGYRNVNNIGGIRGYTGKIAK